jgi:hypothetical protein
MFTHMDHKAWSEQVVSCYLGLKQSESNSQKKKDDVNFSKHVELLALKLQAG